MFAQWEYFMDPLERSSVGGIHRMHILLAVVTDKQLELGLEWLHGRTSDYKYNWLLALCI